MGKIYRVLVIEQDDSRQGMDRWDSGGIAVPAQRVLFEAAGPDAGRLLAYAPDEVAAALDAAQPGEAAPQRIVQMAVDAAGGALVVATEQAPGGGTSIEITRPDGWQPPAPAAQQPAEAPKARRPRRTKAEIEADKAAAAALATGGTVPETAPPIAVGEQSSYVTPDGPVTGDPASVASVPEPVPAESAPAATPPAAAAPPAAPWNPFEQR